MIHPQEAGVRSVGLVRIARGHRSSLAQFRSRAAWRATGDGNDGGGGDHDQGKKVSRRMLLLAAPFLQPGQGVGPRVFYRRVWVGVALLLPAFLRA